MQDFFRTPDGRMTDAEVSQAVEQCAAEVPSADVSAIEAHLTLWRAHNIYATTLSQTYDELGLSVPRFNMLRWLYHSPSHRRSMTELGTYLDASPPNVTRMVKALEEAHWVRRVRGAEDRRQVLVQMTPKGRQDFEKMLPKAIEIWGDMWAGLEPADKALLSDLLTRLRMSLLDRFGDREGPPPAPNRLREVARRQEYERIDLPS